MRLQAAVAGIITQHTFELEPRISNLRLVVPQAELSARHGLPAGVGTDAAEAPWGDFVRPGEHGWRGLLTLPAAYRGQVNVYKRASIMTP